MRRLALAALLLVAAPAFAGAQTLQAQFDRSIHAAAALQLAAQRPFTVAVQPAFVEQGRRARRGNKKSLGTTLMIIGGGAVVTGVIIGDTGGTLLIVGGFVTAGYGLYLYTD